MKKHSKYKNTYLIYEFLIRQLTSELIGGKKLDESNAYKIIKENFTKGILNKEDIYGEIGGIVAGELNIRKKREDITIFDSTGLAVQDVSSSKVIYETAKQKNIGRSIKLVET